VGFERVEQVHCPSHHLAVYLLTVGGDVWNMERLPMLGPDLVVQVQVKGWDGNHCRANLVIEGGCSRCGKYP
jgi:hypothetical protein